MILMFALRYKKTKIRWRCKQGDEDFVYYFICTSACVVQVKHVNMNKIVALNV